MLLSARDIKAKWLTALRSGAYKQGREYLRDREDLFCCLGVLCDVFDPSAWSKDRINGHYRHTGRSDIPNDQYLKQAELEAHEDVGRLMHMNDDQNLSFNTIADWIEGNL